MIFFILGQSNHTQWQVRGIWYPWSVWKLTERKKFGNLRILNHNITVILWKSHCTKTSRFRTKKFIYSIQSDIRGRRPRTNGSCVWHFPVFLRATTSSSHEILFDGPTGFVIYSRIICDEKKNSITVHWICR